MTHDPAEVALVKALLKRSPQLAEKLSPGGSEADQINAVLALVQGIRHIEDFLAKYPEIEDVLDAGNGSLEGL